MKKLITLCALTMALAVPVLAHAAPGDNPQRRLQYVDNTGTLHEVELTDAAKQRMFVAHAMKLKPGTLVMTLDGQIYLLQDAKLPSGQMMSDALMH